MFRAAGGTRAAIACGVTDDLRSKRVETPIHFGDIRVKRPDLLGIVPLRPQGLPPRPRLSLHRQRRNPTRRYARSPVENPPRLPPTKLRSSPPCKPQSARYALEIEVNPYCPAPRAVRVQLVDYEQLKPTGD
jgi:hypothetical protein